MPTLPMVGDELAGYRLRGVLGRGGMSVVYEAENPRLGSTVALKVLAPELATDDVFRARFLKESRTAASLNHPNVIPIYDMGTHEDLLFIAMRYVAGQDLRAVLTHPNTMIGTDGVPSITGKPHPRLYGTFARILGHYVREEKLLTLENAIHRMTGLPAAKFHLADRGWVGEGAYADVVIFDPARVADRTTYLEPRVHPAGIETVIVNGGVVVANGCHTGRRQGRVLRFRCGAAA